MGAFSIGPHGHMTGYVKGCALCREHARTVKREQRMRRGRGPVSTKRGRPTVVPLPTKPGFVDITHLLGTVESATIIECEPYQSDRPAMVAMARTLATLLDDPSLPGLHVQASRQLAAILTTLHRTRTPKSKGRLASVQNLTVKAT